ncbi:MAG TPA: TetR/AcrR family transcriptional regulator [Pseudonocardia sp.]
MGRTDAERLLGAAEALYYTRGIRAVGIDEVRTAAGVSLKRLYQLYPSKEHLVAAYLDARDVQWRGRLADYVARHGGSPRDRMLAVFDWLGLWFAEPDFRGCAFINAFGELGDSAPLVLAAVRRHKDLFRAYLLDLARDLDVPDPAGIGEHLLLLAEGAMTAAAVLPEPRAAQQAGRAAAALLDAAAAERPLRGVEAAVRRRGA